MTGRMVDRMTITPPFPFFGSKRQAAAAVWARLGDVDTYIEPFGGSLAVLLARPLGDTAPRWEYACDLDGLIINVWRAMQKAPRELLALDRGPVSEVQVMAWHHRLNTVGQALTARMAFDVDYFDLELAMMWWAGCSSWIGSGWADGSNPARQRPHIDRSLKGVYAEGMTDEKIMAISARLSNVVLLSGDWMDAWKRVVSDSIMERMAGRENAAGHRKTLGVFLDPPYFHETGRAALYSNDMPLSEQVERWALTHDAEHERIVVAGYRSEYPRLEAAGYAVVDWSRPSGYVNSSGNERREDDVLFCSPTCLVPS